MSSFSGATLISLSDTDRQQVDSVHDKKQSKHANAPRRMKNDFIVSNEKIRKIEL